MLAMNRFIEWNRLYSVHTKTHTHLAALSLGVIYDKQINSTLWDESGGDGGGVGCTYFIIFRHANEQYNTTTTESETIQIRFLDKRS